MVASLCTEFGLDLPARPKAIDTVAVSRPPELAKGHMVFIDNVQGNYFRPEGGGLTLVGVPCQEWDIDPDTLGTGLSPQAGGHGRPAPHASHPGHGAGHPRRAATAPSTATAPIVTPFSVAWTASTGSTSPPRSAAPASRSRPPSACAWPELVLDGRAKTVDIEPFSLRRFAEGRTVEGPYPYAVRADHIDPKAARVA